MMSDRYFRLALLISPAIIYAMLLLPPAVEPVRAVKFTSIIMGGFGTCIFLLAGLTTKNMRICLGYIFIAIGSAVSITAALASLSQGELLGSTIFVFATAFVISGTVLQVTFPIRFSKIVATAMWSLILPIGLNLATWFELQGGHGLALVTMIGAGAAQWYLQPSNSGVSPSIIPTS